MVIRVAQIALLAVHGIVVVAIAAGCRYLIVAEAILLAAAATAVVVDVGGTPRSLVRYSV